MKVRSREKSEGKEPPRDFIRIDAAPKPSVASISRGVTPEKRWLDYYRKHDEKNKVEAMREYITVQNNLKNFREVRAVLVGFLTYHSKDAESWMYSALALAIKEGKGSDADVKESLKYAADLAVRSRNPNPLVSVADQLLLLGYDDQVGPLLDQASAMVPHRGEPLLMSIKLAQRTKDPKRMEEAIRRLLSLGWPGPPGFDEGVRRDARKQAEALARVLREEDRDAEAETLLASLPDAEARDLFIRLSWVGDADLDLVVEDPLGVTTNFMAPRTVGGGSIIKNGYGKHPEEVFVCPRGFDGEYNVRVVVIYNNPKTPAVTANLEVITHEGTPQEHKETFRLNLSSKPPEPVKVTLKDGRRTQALPFVSPNALAIPRPVKVRDKKKGKPAETTKPPGNAPATGAGSAPVPRR